MYAVIALLHQKLLQSEIPDGLNFSEYINELAQLVANSYNNEKKEFSLTVDVDSVEIPKDKIIHFGLIVTELLTNSFKHAFPNRNDGHISVKLKSDGDDFLLEIADGGIGLSDKETFDSNTLGLTLVQRLAKQLGGQLQMESDHGTVVLVRFPR